MMVCGGREGKVVWLAVCSFIICFHITAAGRYVTQNTTGDLARYYLNDLGIEVTRYGHLVFELKACQDAFIFLDETKSHVNYYQIVLGASGNTWCGLRDRCDGCASKVSANGAFLNCSSYVPFWLTWDDQGKVLFGQGGNPGDDVIFTFTDTTTGFEIHYLSVSSYYDQTGSWNLLIDGSPVFTAPSPDGNTTIDVSENAKIGETIFSLAATDPENDVISFAVIGQHVDVFKCVGNDLTLNADLDFETTNFYRVYVRANDSRNLVEVSLNVRVTDEIDEVPRIILSHVTSVQEELPEGAMIGPFFQATDADVQDILIYSLLGPDQGYFTINSSTGEMLTKTRLDRDGAAGKTDVSVTVTVTDSASFTSSVDVTLRVLDINDNVPQFTQSVYYVNVTENSTADTLLGELTCADEDSGDNSNISLTIVNGDDAGNPKFSIRGLDLFADGTSLDYESVLTHEYTLTVAAVDNPGGVWQNTGTAVVVIQVLPENEYAPVWVSPVTNSSDDFPSHVIPENCTDWQPRSDIPGRRQG
ncbi:protocadherin beta-9-like [Gigantopelta aegis]|uniref:protocadherin beta-9-like n=1 Tax=Gigantopelta aegis TaxID=1735272 RepID=UPI001B889DBD|nr:protocadherin beta-9-like [Gigantopelta aegis]XP_041372475.1 protocadherin beta-9-like [Gigantopelta aegis]